VNRSDVFKKTFGAKSGSAICLIVRAYGSRYGFCTYLFLLIPNKDKRWKKFDRLVSEEEKEKLRREKKTILKENKKKAKEESKQKKLRKQKEKSLKRANKSCRWKIRRIRKKTHRTKSRPMGRKRNLW